MAAESTGAVVAPAWDGGFGPVSRLCRPERQAKGNEAGAEQGQRGQLRHGDAFDFLAHA
jgi:hypothetical protein